MRCHAIFLTLMLDIKTTSPKRVRFASIPAGGITIEQVFERCNASKEADSHSQIFV
jgi:hypothetical protein